MYASLLTAAVMLSNMSGIDLTQRLILQIKAVSQIADPTAGNIIAQPNGFTKVMMWEDIAGCVRRTCLF